MPGPPPKRSDQRRRVNKTPGLEHAAAAPLVTQPKPSAGWHRIAKEWYLALAASGQAKFYEPSDWAQAQLLAEIISRELRPQPVGVNPATGKVVRAPRAVTAATITAFLRGATSLMATEGDRRRLRLELERPPEELKNPDVTDLEEYKRLLGSG